MTQFGRQLEREVFDAGMTSIRQFAIAIGKHGSTVSRWTHSRLIPTDALKEILAGFSNDAEAQKRLLSAYQTQAASAVGKMDPEATMYSMLRGKKPVSDWERCIDFILTKGESDLVVQRTITALAESWGFKFDRRRVK